MELLFEFLGELLFEGLVEVIQNKKVSKWIRYPLLGLVSVFYLAIMGLLVMVGYRLFQTRELVGGIAIVFCVVLLCLLFITFLFKLWKKGK